MMVLCQKKEPLCQLYSSQTFSHPLLSLPNLVSLTSGLYLFLVPLIFCVTQRTGFVLTGLHHNMKTPPCFKPTGH